jgi:hypothetical protein
MPCIIENKTCSTILVATNLMQATEFLRLHKIQKVIFQNIKLTCNKQKSKPKTQSKTQQKLTSQKSITKLMCFSISNHQE